MSQLSDFATEGLTASLEIAGDSFTWDGDSYPAIIDHERAVLTAAKSAFPDGYPPIGASIIVAGKKRQVNALANSELELVPGGEREKEPFVDDPGDPAIAIAFGSFTK